MSFIYCFWYIVQKLERPVSNFQVLVTSEMFISPTPYKMNENSLITVCPYQLVFDISSSYDPSCLFQSLVYIFSPCQMASICWVKVCKLKPWATGRTGPAGCPSYKLLQAIHQRSIILDLYLVKFKKLRKSLLLWLWICQEVVCDVAVGGTDRPWCRYYRVLASGDLVSTSSTITMTHTGRLILLEFLWLTWTPTQLCMRSRF